MAERRRHFIIDPNPILRDAAYFTRSNDLNGDGRILFWKEVDECIRLFNMHKLKLMPRKGGDSNKLAEKTDSAAQLRFKLPPPKPKNEAHTYHQDDKSSVCQDRRYDRSNRYDNASPRTSISWSNGNKHKYNY